MIFEDLYIDKKNLYQLVEKKVKQHEILSFEVFKKGFVTLM